MLAKTIVTTGAPVPLDRDVRRYARPNAVFILVLMGLALAWPTRLVAQTMQLVGTGSIELRLVHKFQKVVSVSHEVMVRGIVDESGLKVVARAPVASFDSHNTNRDEYMMEAIQGKRYPWAVLRVFLPDFKLPSVAGRTKIQTEASVELHGVAVNHPIEMVLETQDGRDFQVSFAFDESMTAHHIERPIFLFMPVHDQFTIRGKADIEVTVQVQNRLVGNVSPRRR